MPVFRLCFYTSISFVTVATTLPTMEHQVLIVVLIVSLSSLSGAAECETGWSMYKDETCVRIFDDLLTYNDAKYFCASKSTSISTSTLVMVKEQGVQDFLVDLSADFYENIWLGSKYDANSSQFIWDDGELLTYTNWVEGFPRNITDSEVCIQMRPVRATTTNDLEGKWEDAVCQKRALVMCQRTLVWTLEDAVREIIKNRKDFQDQISELREEVDRVNEELDRVNSKVVPVGSIYVEYYDQPNPVTLWPSLDWDDITNSYAGMFFRALGGGSANWGVNQGGCAPRITQSQYGEAVDGRPIPDLLPIPDNGWSALGKTGMIFQPGTAKMETIKFYTEGCEVRPKNQAIRIWKRVA